MFGERFVRKVLVWKCNRLLLVISAWVYICIVQCVVSIFRWAIQAFLQLSCFHKSFSQTLVQLHQYLFRQIRFWEGEAYIKLDSQIYLQQHIWQVFGDTVFIANRGSWSAHISSRHAPSIRSGANSASVQKTMFLTIIYILENIIRGSDLYTFIISKCHALPSHIYILNLPSTRRRRPKGTLSKFVRNLALSNSRTWNRVWSKLYPKSAK